MKKSVYCLGDLHFNLNHELLVLNVQLSTLTYPESLIPVQLKESSQGCMQDVFAEASNHATVPHSKILDRTYIAKANVSGSILFRKVVPSAAMDLVVRLRFAGSVSGSR